MTLLVHLTLLLIIHPKGRGRREELGGGSWQKRAQWRGLDPMNVGEETGNVGDESLLKTLLVQYYVLVSQIHKVLIRTVSGFLDPQALKIWFRIQIWTRILFIF